MKLTYIPYSIRNNITDKDLAGLLDYLERDMGWKIDHEKLVCESRIMNENFYKKRKKNRYEILIHFLKDPDGTVKIRHTKDSLPFFHMPHRLFFRTYKSILPAIRDLYLIK